MNRPVFAALFLLLAVSMPTAASAQTDDTPPAGPNGAGEYCPHLSQTLTRGMRDSVTVPPGQVTELQKFLSDYYDIDPDDIVTGYFGALTQRSVIRFQKEQGLPSYGIVESLTRAAIAKKCGTLTGDDAQQAYSCSFNGRIVADGESVVAYASSTVPWTVQCASERRTCIKGVLSGSYMHASCSPSAPPGKDGSDCMSLTDPMCYAKHSCIQDGVTVAHGASRLFYSTRTGTTCASELRTCADGALSGSYPYAACAVPPTLGTACTFNGQTIADGGSVLAYASSTVPYGGQCKSETRMCVKGVLSGSFSYAGCAVNPQDDAAAQCLKGANLVCRFNGRVIQDGDSVVAYDSSSPDGILQCKSETRHCICGVLTGSYQSSSCGDTNKTGGSCSFNGQTIPHGGSVLAYLAASSAQCVSETRTCTNGVLSGSYGYASCTTTGQNTPLTDANCESHPNGYFSAYPTSGPAPLSVIFTYSMLSTSLWDGLAFGDGTTMPQGASHLSDGGYWCTRHTYVTSGTYTAQKTWNGQPVTGLSEAVKVTVW